MEEKSVVNKTRDPYFDIIKGFAILLVVAGHCIQYGNGAEYLCDKEYFENVFFRIIYSFHMPLFMMICGYFFYTSASKRTLVKVVSNKCKTVLLPILTFGILSYLIWEIPEYYNGFSLRNIGIYLRECSNHTRQSLWFFWALFKLSIIVSFIQKGAKDNNFVHIIVLLLILFFPITKISELEKSVYPFFLLGYWAKKNDWWTKLQKLNKKYLLISLGIIYTICLYYFHKDTFVYTTGVTIWHSDLEYTQILIDVQRIFTGFTGSLFCLMLVKFVYGIVKIDAVVSSLTFLGKYSGGVYCVHSALIPVDKFVSVLPEAMNSGGVILVPVLIYSIGLSWIFSKNKYTDYLFLGGR